MTDFSAARDRHWQVQHPFRSASATMTAMALLDEPATKVEAMGKALLSQKGVGLGYRVPVCGSPGRSPVGSE
ncbi:hypothetical protein Vau01_016480 [Virgisporangium aurantiacum]|uniref:Uncharacterized protein n=1 Tax=Virgisporangium aurantiacum TaxID=175570 RepID=A0A8J4DZK6_9ACTN|nr:hypothetical protein Vau01_016480 [Virgisporangium aurantiacum]